MEVVSVPMGESMDLEGGENGTKVIEDGPKYASWPSPGSLDLEGLIR